MVLQDTWLFGGTIRENLRYGNPDATDEQIYEAARVTYVDRFVHSLPDGYDTMINDEGDNISTGEKQLMTIARAFLNDPAILILDEATSSVDTRTEVLIQEAMNNLRANRTSFVIAHRLSTIRGADVILVMEDGQIVEQGNHDSLLEAHGAYWRLYNAQFAGNTMTSTVAVWDPSAHATHSAELHDRVWASAALREHGELVLDRRGDLIQIRHHVAVRRDAEVELVVVRHDGDRQALVVDHLDVGEHSQEAGAAQIERDRWPGDVGDHHVHRDRAAHVAGQAGRPGEGWRRRSRGSGGRRRRGPSPSAPRSSRGSVRVGRPGRTRRRAGRR